jgi:hypothetical protein
MFAFKTTLFTVINIKNNLIFTKCRKTCEKLSRIHDKKSSAFSSTSGVLVLASKISVTASRFSPIIRSRRSCTTCLFSGSVRMTVSPERKIPLIPWRKQNLLYISWAISTPSAWRITGTRTEEEQIILDFRNYINRAKHHRGSILPDVTLF